jgi:hypothetical protein
MFKQVEKKSTSPKAVLFESLGFHLYYPASKNLWDMDVRPISSMSGRCRKTPLTVILKDVMAPAECYVSRSLWGSRQLAITLQLETGELLGDLFWGESLRMGKQI